MSQRPGTSCARTGRRSTASTISRPRGPIRSGPRPGQRRSSRRCGPSSKAGSPIMKRAPGGAAGQSLRRMRKRPKSRGWDRTDAATPGACPEKSTDFFDQNMLQLLNLSCVLVDRLSPRDRDASGSAIFERFLFDRTSPSNREALSSREAERPDLQRPSSGIALAPAFVNSFSCCIARAMLHARHERCPR